MSKLFSNKYFGAIFLVIAAFDLIYSISRVTENFEYASVGILRYLSVGICLAAVLSFFIITRYSLPILKFYIVFKYMILPLYMLSMFLKDVVFYMHNRFTPEISFQLFFALMLGVTLYYFFKKYRTE